MKYKSVFILFLLIFSVAFGGVSKPPAAFASIYKVNSNLTPVYTFRNDLTGGKISMGLLVNSLFQLNNQIIGNVAQLTSSQADDTYLRLDTTNNPLTGQLLTIDGTKTIPAYGPASNTDFGVYFTTDTWNLSVNDTAKWLATADLFGTSSSSGGRLRQTGASGTSPFTYDSGDSNSGPISEGADVGGYAVGGVTAILHTEDTNKLETEIKGSLALNSTDINTATYTVLQNDYFLECRYTATGAVTSLALPSIATLAKSYIYVVIDSSYNANTNNITVVRNGSDTINNVGGNYVISNDGAVVKLKANITTSNWEIIN